jgi:hypothetical protein
MTKTVNVVEKKEVFTPVRPLFDGPIDIVGDVHGEYQALRQLLKNLGYDNRGDHREGRRLVFLGDLIDRGPQNRSVVWLVRDLMEAGVAQCILGNHEFNLLRRLKKDGNAWFYGSPLDDGRPAFDEVLTADHERGEMLTFLGGLPIALERPDLRVVHACWDDASIDLMRQPATVMDVFEEHRQRLSDELAKGPPREKIEEDLFHQNRNPVKVLTSGPEYRHTGFLRGSKMRYNQRVKWWNDYDSPVFCAFGHYSRVPLGDPAAYSFEDDEPDRALGRGACSCIDHAGGSRPAERRLGVVRDFVTRLTALRWPERELVDDLGERRMMGPQRPRPDCEQCRISS